MDAESAQTMIFGFGLLVGVSVGALVTVRFTKQNPSQEHQFGENVWKLIAQCIRNANVAGPNVTSSTVIDVTIPKKPQPIDVRIELSATAQEEKSA